MRMPDTYVGSDRHKRPWRVGASGSQCGDADGEALFAAAVAHPGTRGSASPRTGSDGSGRFRTTTPASTGA